MPLTHHFPTVPPESLLLERDFRSSIAALAEEARLAAYSVLTRAHSAYAPTTFQLHDDIVVAHQRGAALAFPRPLPIITHAHVAFGYVDWKFRKYTLPGFVDVNPGDVVLDCGAYVGGFALGAQATASHVHVFEPEPRNFACLARNLENAGNVSLNQLALYNRVGSLSLNISSSSVEHSILAPDNGDTVSQLPVDVVSIAEYFQAGHLERLDFVKIDAEGVEPEVVAGFGAIRPRNLAVDVSPERDGESPAAELLGLLVDMGYETRTRGHVLFARAQR